MRRVAEKNLTRTEALSRTFALSYPLLAGDTEDALRVVQESLNDWDLDWLAQKHRTYHKPRPNRTPNKMIFSRPALLQFIVCEQTTPYEIKQEADFLDGRRRLTERTLVLRFIKQLLHESCSRSFNVTVGVCRVLHKYDHATTRRFYAVLDQRDQEFLIQGELDNKTDDEYRRWKMKLIDKLEDRFKEFVSVTRCSRNEKRFLPNNRPEAWAEYTRECLIMLTPWATEHVLPPEFVPTDFNIPKLKCDGRQDDWDSAEENRMHTIIDPECLSRLAKACGVPAPEQQLDVPQFKSVEQGSGADGDDQTVGTPELTFAQAKPILDELDKRASRRRVAVSEYLSVEVDGVERGQLDTAAGSDLRLDLHPESRRIQVFTTDAEGKLLLASLWLGLIDITPDEGWESSIVLEGGQRLGIDIKLVLNPTGELESLAARISYQECNPLRILTHYFQRILRVVSEQLQLDTALNYARLLQAAVYGHRSALAVFLLFAAVALSLITTRYNSRPPTRTDARAERINDVGRRPADPPSTSTNPFAPDTNIARNLGPGTEAREKQPASPPHTVNQAREQITSSSPRSEAPASIGLESAKLRERMWEISGVHKPTPQREAYDSHQDKLNIGREPLESAIPRGNFILSDALSPRITRPTVGIIGEPEEATRKEQRMATVSNDHARVPALTVDGERWALPRVLPPIPDPNSGVELASIIGAEPGPRHPPLGLFTIYDGDPSNADIMVVPLSVNVHLSDYLELFFSTEGYRGVNVNNPKHLSSFYLPNSQLFDNGIFGSGPMAGAGVAFPGIGSPCDSILPGVVLATRTSLPYLTLGALTVPELLTTCPTYLLEAPFINSLYGKSTFGQMNFGAKFGLTDPDNPLGVGIVPFWRFYLDQADDQSGFNQLQRGASPSTNFGDIGLVGFVSGRLSRSVNLSANFIYILNSNPQSDVFSGDDVTLLDRRDELAAGTGFDFPVNHHFQPIVELKSVHYVRGRTPNAFPNNPVDFPQRWSGFSAWYRAHLNQQGERFLNSDPDFPAGFQQSTDPHGFGVQFFIGHRNERLPTIFPNQPPTVTLTASSSRVVLGAECPPGQRPNEACTPTSATVQLSANATDPDGDTLLYTYSTTGGRIVGDGPNATLDMTGVAPGTYTVTVEVDDGCGCIAFTSTTITVVRGAPASPLPSASPDIDAPPSVHPKP